MVTVKESLPPVPFLMVPKFLDVGDIDQPLGSVKASAVEKDVTWPGLLAVKFSRKLPHCCCVIPLTETEEALVDSVSVVVPTDVNVTGPYVALKPAMSVPFTVTLYWPAAPGGELPVKFMAVHLPPLNVPSLVLDAFTVAFIDGDRIKYNVLVMFSPTSSVAMAFIVTLVVCSTMVASVPFTRSRTLEMFGADSCIVNIVNELLNAGLADELVRFTPTPTLMSGVADPFW